MSALEAMNLRPNDQLEQYLVENDIVSQQAIDATKLETKYTNEDAGVVLVRNGFIKQSELVKLRIKIDATNLTRDRVIVASIPTDVLVRTNTIMVAETEEKLYAATMSSQLQVQMALAQYDPRPVEFVSLSLSDLNAYIADLQRMRSQDDDSLLERLVRNALRGNVSDIHIKPRMKTYSVFYRYLGVLQIVHEGTIDEYQLLNSRIKNNAKMDIAERRIPQGGGFQIEYKRNMVDLRVEAVPTPEGEVIIIRLLNPDSVNPNLNKLGITGVQQWRSGFQRVDGLCLVCGPTGSGKTTTLNSTVREVNRFERSIYTVEDPVEYNIPYISQVNVNQSVGLSFSRAVKSFMRADPDIIVVGEIRDEETAENMMKAAETGHMVLATLHTGSILGVVSRLREIGVNVRDLRYLLRSVLVQRLIRTTCKHCQGEGCGICYQSGYGGRTIISECAYFGSEEEVEAMMEGKRTWKTLVEDAVDKYEAGETDQRELLRVFAGEAEAILRQRGIEIEQE